MSKKTELVDKLEAFLIENKSIKTETFKEIYPFLNDIRKQLSICNVLSTCCDETRKVNQFLKRPSKYCMTCSKELK